MFVIATAGHVDHGKSTLVHRLTGMWPDRLAEEQRRGLTIDLGFAWTEIDGRELAFVDVPGHERFVANMLAGVGPVPAVMFVVAATEGWMPQSEEHLAALQALGVQHALVVISKADLADPQPAIDQVQERFAGAPVVLGTDLDRVRAGLVALVDRLPEPKRDSDIRLWVDRSFTVRGAGTVVTGTLAAGTIRVGDELEQAGRRVTVRGLQSLGRDETEVGAVARVAVNLRGVDRQHIGRGDTVRTPGAWLDTAEIDVALRCAGKLHRNLVLHVGSAAVPVYVRPLGTAARLRLARRCPCASETSGFCGTPASTGLRRASRCSTCVHHRCVAAAQHGPGPTNWQPAVPGHRYAHAQMSCAPWVLR
jgi:selenocysteine-specific elongation factor